MALPTTVPRYTEEVRHFPDDRVRYEVIRGELFVTPAPGTVHQRTVLELGRAPKRAAGSNCRRVPPSPILIRLTAAPGPLESGVFPLSDGILQQESAVFR